MTQRTEDDMGAGVDSAGLSDPFSQQHDNNGN